jgi:hypothetical protein
VTRIQLRPIRTEAEEHAFYAERYPEGYCHSVWPDHVERVGASVEHIRRYMSQIKTAADLSCGDGAIVKALAPDLTEAYLGDINGVSIATQLAVKDAGCPKVITVGGRALPDSLWALPEREHPVDLLVLSETLEHVPDPDGLLRSAAHFGRYLFLSTPLDEHPSVGNPEHYWGWGQGDIHEMLWDSGWSPLDVKLLVPESTRHMSNAYTYQLWMAVHR